MRNLLHLALIVWSVLIPSGLLFASDAYIKTDKSTGQGFLFERDRTCYLATPEHVVEDVSSISFMTADRKTHKAEIIKTFDVDLAILKVSNYKVCNHKQPEAKTRLGSLLKVYPDGILKSRLSDGSMLQTKVTIKGIDQAEYLQILPRKKSDILKQGFSGSILYVAEQPAGMLLEVDDENVGYVYRQDAISKVLLNHFNPATVNNTKKKLQKTIPIIGSIKGDIDKGKEIDFTFSWNENSPVILAIPKTKSRNSYTLFILNAAGEEQHKQRVYGNKSYKFAFTPTSTEVHTIRLVGTNRKSQFSINIDQLALNSQLRAASNIVESGDSLKGTIAKNSIAEFKYVGTENSPITLQSTKTNSGLRYDLLILDEEGEQQYKGTFYGYKSSTVAFTPTTNGLYTINLVGIKGHGKFEIKVAQLSLDSELRGKGNVIEAGDSFTGTIAKNAIAEIKYTGIENSPIILSLDKIKRHYFQYTMIILNADGEEQYKSHFNGNRKYKFPFTPISTGVYTIRLVGTREYGKFSLKLDQLTLDSELRGVGNVVEVGDSLSGIIAINGIAEFKYAGAENSPITLSIAKTKRNYRYTLTILNANGEEQFKDHLYGTRSYKYAFTPTSTGVYTIRLVGTSGYGKFSLKLDQLALDSELRGAGNEVKAGESLNGIIAMKSIAEFKYAGVENIPVTLTTTKIKRNYRYTLTILNAAGKVQYKQNVYSTKSNKYVFTPSSTGVHTIMLKGTKGYGKFEIKVN